jgi:hypothetical protein
MYLLVISGDVNDADYLEETFEIDEEELTRLRFIFNTINVKAAKVEIFSPEIDVDEACKHLTEDQIDILYNYLPCDTVSGDYVHSIAKVVVYEYIHREALIGL